MTVNIRHRKVFNASLDILKDVVGCSKIGIPASGICIG
jgi:hypothetical protein